MIDYFENKLLAYQQLDGGFGYYKDEKSFIEPTVYALMALNQNKKNKNSLLKGISYLLNYQNTDGGWLFFDGDNQSSSVATALALLCLSAIDKQKFKSPIYAGREFLEKTEYYLINDEMDEIAWGWTQRSFISIEATAYAVLSLKKSRSSNQYRIKEGEQFFEHNICDCGGWSYGHPIDKNNPASTKVYYTPLTPQIHITSLVLLALQNKKEKQEKNIKYLADDFKNSVCPMSLSFAALALDCYKKTENLPQLLKHLNNIMHTDDYVKEMPFYIALSLLANLTFKGYNPLCMTN